MMQLRVRVQFTANAIFFYLSIKTDVGSGVPESFQRVLRESSGSLQGVLTESSQSPQGVFKESSGSPQEVFRESSQSPGSPHGVLRSLQGVLTESSGSP
jgi:hypothetical protein